MFPESRYFNAVRFKILKTGDNMNIKELKGIINNMPDDYKVCVLVSKNGDKTIYLPEEAHSVDTTPKLKEVCIS